MASMEDEQAAAFRLPAPMQAAILEVAFSFLLFRAGSPVDKSPTGLPS